MLKSSHNKIAVTTFVYPNSLAFFQDFLESCTHQTFQEFDLIVFNDGATSLETFDFSHLSYTVINVSGNICNIRLDGLNELKKMGYTKTILLDSDDTMSNDRVEKAVHALDSCDIALSDLNTMSINGIIEEKEIWTNRLNQLEELNHNSITTYNFLGLGNTSINLSKVSFSLPSDLKLIAFDWYLYYRIIRDQSLTVGLLNGGTVNYRQHNENIAGINTTITLQSIEKAINVKILHYTQLNVDYPKEFDELINQYTLFLNLLKAGELKIGTRKINAPFWWEHTQLIEHEKNKAG